MISTAGEFSVKYHTVFALEDHVQDFEHIAANICHYTYQLIKQSTIIFGLYDKSVNLDLVVNSIIS